MTVPVTRVVQNFIDLPEKQNRVGKILNKTSQRNIFQKRHSQQSAEQHRRRAHQSSRPLNSKNPSKLVSQQANIKAASRGSVTENTQPDDNKTKEKIKSGL